MESAIYSRNSGDPLTFSASGDLPVPLRHDGGFTFKLRAPANTSAGVYTPEGVLVKTLWSTVRLNAGTYTRYWDGTDDFGVKLSSPSSKYEIRILSNNVTYTWDGVIGNTSDAKSGPSIHRGYYHAMRGLAIANGVGYMAKGYSEGHSSIGRFSLAKPQAKVTIFPGHVLTLNTDHVATDGVTVYWGGFDAFSSDRSMVAATKISDDSEVSFQYGSSYQVTYGMFYQSVIDKTDKPQSQISGLAVQKLGNLLFVSRSGLNELHVLDKRTGALLQNLNITTPGALAVDGSDRLWMISGAGMVARYQVTQDGQLSAPTLMLNGLVDPMAVQVSPDDATVVVADGGTSQQLKAFNASTGAPAWVYGKAGGYQSDPSVTDEKFMFSSVRGKEAVFIAFQPDGSFWVNDPGNLRVQHYASDRSYINRIMSLGASYFTGVDRNNITRVFSEFLEFEVDYSVPLTGSSGWRLLRNWGANLYKGAQPMFATTFSNGRTYGFCFFGDNSMEVVEYVVSSGIRRTGIVKMGKSMRIGQDGSLEDFTPGESGKSAILMQYPLLGFDAANNPIWAPKPKFLATAPPYRVPDPNATAPFGLTSSGKVIFYTPDIVDSWKVGSDGSVSPGQYHTGYHLGAMRTGENKWLWKTELSTHLNYRGAFPPAGTFDIGNKVNQYAGGLVMVSGQNIFTSYHGEFWKDGQTNKYNHYYDDGLALGQFGTTRAENQTDSAPMMAGNALSPVVVKAPNGDLYLWHGDESDHAGVHRWTISGLNTIAEQAIPIAYPSEFSIPKSDYVDLMQGLPFDQPLQDGIAGWSRSPATNYVTQPWVERWEIATSVLKFDKLTSPDVMVQFVASSARTNTLSRSLENNSATESWKIAGEVAYPGNMPNAGAVFQYLEVLDASGKVIVSFSPEINRGTNVETIRANTAALASEPAGSIQYYMNELRNLEITASAAGVSVSYGKYPAVLVPALDPQADWRRPATLRVRAENIGNGYPAYGANIGLKDFKFYRQ